ncbi:MAG: hypothetical protein NT075_16720, partial [Chloroflexi bacterium]|nr:hypothetical protein [Chloroflexota bacterium]
SEPDLPSITVIITDSLGVTHTVSTDANGNYTATVPVGSTTADVDEATLPAGYVQTAGADPSTVTALAGNTIDIGNDGYQPQGAVTGHIFEDTDGNGAQDGGEPDLPNITVVITDSLGVTHTVTTDANGNYTTTVPVGLTIADVDETTLPAGYVQTGGSDPSPVTVVAGNTTNVPSGGYQPQSAVTGHIFEDTNGNGTQDEGEPNLSGIHVVITDSLGATQTVTTLANGNYVAIVPAGSTSADVDETTLPAGYVQTAGDDPSTVTVPSGTPVSIGNDGYQPQGLVNGHLFVDTNGNGAQDQSEPNLPNVTVVITDSLGMTYPMTSDANGNYTTTVPAGPTIADVDESTLPVGYVQTAGSDPSPVIALAGKITSVGNDGYQPQGAVRGHVFKDTNGNAIQNENEPDLPGVRLVITNSLGMTQTATTDAHGDYTATVPAGATKVDVDETTLPVGSVQTAGNDPSTVTVPMGTVTSAGNAGYQPQGIISGHIYKDSNGNGQQDEGEPNLPDVMVIITDSLGITHVVTTDRSGKYQLGVPVGLTTADIVESSLPPGLIQSAGSDPMIVDVLPGQKVLIVSDGYTLAHTASLGGFLWIDVNGNGKQDQAEMNQPLVGSVVSLFLADSVNSATAQESNPLAVQTTGNDGRYLFTNLQSGNYVVQIVAPTGYISTQGGADPNNDDDTDSNGVPVGNAVRSLPVTLQTGTEPTNDGDTDADTNLTVDFGFYLFARMGDYVWSDANGNGIQDTDETGIANVTITLYSNVPSELIPNAGQTTKVALMKSDAQGHYQFDQLAPGAYIVEFTPPADYTASPMHRGGNDANDSDVDVSTDFRTLPITLRSGEYNATLDAGLIQVPTGLHPNPEPAAPVQSRIFLPLINR